MSNEDFSHYPNNKLVYMHLSSRLSVGDGSHVRRHIICNLGNFVRGVGACSIIRADFPFRFVAKEIPMNMK